MGIWTPHIKVNNLIFVTAFLVVDLIELTLPSLLICETPISKVTNSRQY